MGKSYKDQNKFDKKQKSKDYVSKKEKSKKKRPVYEETIEESLEGEDMEVLPKSHFEMLQEQMRKDFDEEDSDYYF